MLDRHRIHQLTHNAASSLFILQNTTGGRRVDEAVAQKAARHLKDIIDLTHQTMLTDTMLGQWVTLMSVYVTGADWQDTHSVETFNKRCVENPMPNISGIDASLSGDLVDRDR